MANSDKNIRITPNKNTANYPKIVFTGQSNAPITLNVLDDNTISFEGTSGQLLSISDQLTTGIIFSISNISGIPSFRINADGTVGIAEFSGNVGVGISVPAYKLHVSGTFGATGNALFISNTNSTSSTTGAVVVTGGLGVSGRITSGTGLSITGAGTFTGALSASSLTLTTALTLANGGTGLGTTGLANQILGMSNASTGLEYKGVFGGVGIAVSNSPNAIFISSTSGSGISSLNGLTATTQTFAIGTSGTEFNIVSSTSTHTFNLPAAGTGSSGTVTTGTQTFAGAKTFNGALTAASTLSVTGAATFISTANIAGATIIGSSLDVGSGLGVTGAVTLRSTLTVFGTGNISGATVIGSTLDVAAGFGVTGAATLRSTLTVFGTGNISGATVIGSTLDVASGFGVTGATILRSTVESRGILTVSNNTQSTSSTSGAVVITGGLGVSGHIEGGSGLEILGAARIGGGLGVTGSIDISGNIGVLGSENITGGLGVTGAATLRSTLTVFGTGNISGATVIGSSLDVGAGFGVTGAATLKSTLNVSGATIVGSSLDVGAGFGVTGAATLRSTLTVFGTGNISGATIIGSTLDVAAGFGVTGAVVLRSTVQANGVVTITSTAGSNSPSSGALVVSGGVGIGGTVTVNSGLVVGSGTTGLIFTKLVGGNYIAMYSTAIAPDATNYTFITDGQSPNFNGTFGVYFNISNSNKVAITSTNINILPTTESTSTSSGALTVVGGVGIGGSAYVGGALYTNALRISGNTQSISSTTGALTVTGGLGVSGNLNVGTGLTVLGSTHFASNTQSTSSTTGAAVITGGLGVSGNLNVGGALSTASLSLTGNTQSTSSTTGTLTVTGGVGVSGNLNVGTGLTVFGSTHFVSNTNSTSSTTGAIIVSGGLGVSGNIDGGSGLEILGAARFGSGLGVTGSIDISGNIGILGSENIAGGLGVTGAATLRSTLTVFGTGNISGATIIGSTLNVAGGFGVTGAATLRSTLTVFGTGNISGATIIGSTLDVASGFGVTGAATLRSTLTVFGTGNISGATIIGSTLDVASGFGVTGAVTLRSTLVVFGTGNISGATVIGSTLDVAGGLGVTGATTLRSTLSVTGIATLSNSTDATSTSSGALVVTGGVGVGGTVFALNLKISGSANLNSLSLTTPLAVTSGGTGTATGSITGTAALTFTAGGSNTNINLVPNGTGTVDVSSKRISSLATPTNATDAATKAYVDQIAQGINYHDHAEAATTAGLGATYQNGTLGVGATLQASPAAAWGTSLADGVTLGVGDRFLVKNQGQGGIGATIQNGVYTLTQQTSPWVLTRATDYDNSIAGEVAPGDSVFVAFGNTNALTTWTQSTYGIGDSSGSILIGTDNITFIQTSGAGTFNGDGSTISITGSIISIASGYVGQTSITTVGTLGSLTVSGATILNSTLRVDGVTTYTSNINSTSSTTGAIVVTGGIGVSGNITVGSNENVSGASNLTTLGVSGNANITGGLGVTGASNLSTLGVSGAINVNGAIGVTGAATLRSTLTVFGTGNISGATVIGSTLDVASGFGVTGATTLRSTLTVFGTGNISGATIIGSTLDVAGGFGVTGAATLRSTLTVFGTGNISGATVIGSTLDVASGFGVTGAAILRSTLNVLGGVGLSSNTQSTSSTTGALIIQGGIGVSGNIFAGSGFTVAGIAHFASNTQSTSSTTGAVVITGGLGVSGRITAGSGISSSGGGTFTGALSASSLVLATALPLTSGGTGIGTTGTANQILGMVNASSGLEYKTLTQGTNITITHGVGTVTISASGGSATPGGPTNSIQYNGSGALAGVGGFLWDNSSQRVDINNTTSVGLGTTVAFKIENSTASTVGAPLQFSPAIEQIGRAYKSSGTPLADWYVRFLQMVETSSGATPGGALVWKSANHSVTTQGPTYTKEFEYDITRGLGLYESTGAFKSSFIPGAQTTDIYYTLPATLPSTNQVLSAQTISGSAVTLTWAASGSGSGTVNTGASGKVAYYPSAGTTVDDATAIDYATSGVHVIITSQTATDIPLRLDGNASASVNLFQVRKGATDEFVVNSTGVISVGTWNADAIGIAYGGTNLTSTPTNGQLLIGNGSGYTLAGIGVSGALTKTEGSGSLSLKAKRPLYITLASGYTPGTGTTADTNVVRIPEDPASGTTSLNYTIRELFCRVETPSAGTTTFQVDYYTGTSLFTATTLLSSALSISGTTNYETSTTSFSTATLNSGTKLRLNFSAIDSTHANFFIQLLLEET